MSAPDQPTAGSPGRAFSNTFEDRIGRILLEQQLITPEELKTIRGELLQAFERGENAPPLAQALLRKGIIDTHRLVRLLQEARQIQLRCRKCAHQWKPQGWTSTDQPRCPNCGAADSTVEDLPTGFSLLSGEVRKLGRYHLVREIARGGMGVVYEAVDPQLKRPVALKVIRDPDGREDQVKRLHREAQLAATISHPNVVPIFEVGVDQADAGLPPVHFIAMDYIEGETLADRARLLGLEEKMRVLEQVAGAVGAAHGRGVVHRDLKPANVILSKDGRPFVTDFGLARMEEGEQSRLTRSGAMVGTVSYMAPEQATGDRDAIDARTDVWALGVMMYELLTRSLPFTGTTTLETFSKILNHEPVRPRKRRKGIPRDLETICCKSLEKDKGRRYDDGAELARDLERWRKDEPIAARPRSAIYLLAKAIKRNPWSVPSFLLALAALAWGLWFGMAEPRRIVVKEAGPAPTPPARLEVLTQHRRITLDVYVLEEKGARASAQYTVPFPAGLRPALAPGRYRFRFSRAGFLPRSIETRAESSTTLRLQVNLVPIEIWTHDLSNEVSAAVHAGDFDRSGTLDVLAMPRNLGPRLLEHGFGRTRWRVRWRQSPASFYWLPQGDAAIADLDGNGALDILVNLGFGSGSHVVALGSADGAYLWYRKYDGEFLAADLDGDGAAEVVWVGHGQGSGIEILEGASGRPLRRFPGPYAGRPVAADVDGDGRPEILVRCLGRGANGIAVLDARTGRRLALHRGLGQFSAGDMDGDGRADVVAWQAGGRRLVCGRGVDGRVLFRSAAGIDTSQRPWLLHLGKTDGRLDVLGVARDGSLHAFSGVDGKLLWRSPRPAGRDPGQVHPPLFCDWDGDGALDVTLVTGKGKVVALSGLDGRILWSHDLGEPVPQAGAIADRNDDGVGEVYVATSSGKLEAIAPRLDLAWWYRLPAMAVDLAVVRAPEGPSVVLATLDGQLLGFDLGTGQPRFVTQTSASSSGVSSYMALVAHDVDGDGTGDVWLGGARVEARSGRDGSLRWERTFAGRVARVDRVGALPADLDGDGVPDPVVEAVTTGKRSAAIALSGRTGRTLWQTDLGPAATSAAGWHERRPVVADVDGDRKLDVLVALRDGTLVALRGSDGKVLWRWAGLEPRNVAPHLRVLICSPGVADLDGDGRPDVIQPSGWFPHLLRGRDGRPLPIDRRRLVSHYHRGQPLALRLARGVPHLVVPTERALTAYRLPGLQVTWQHQRRTVDGQLVFNPPFVADLTGDGVDDLLVGTDSGFAFLLDGRDGRVLWQTRAGRQIMANPVAVRVGGRWLALLATEEPRLHAVWIRLTKRGSAWPGARAGSGDTGNVEAIADELEKERLLIAMLRVRDPERTSASMVRSAAEAYGRKAGIDAWYLYMLGHFNAHFVSGRHGALASLDRALVKMPNLYPARLLRAEIVIGQGEHAKGIADLDRILVPGSRTARAYVLRGEANRRLGRHRAAVVDFSDAMRLDPGNLEPFYRRALALMALKDDVRAESDLSHILSVAPSFRVHLDRGRLRERLGRIEEARADYRSAFQWVRTSDEQRQARAALARLDRTRR